MSSLRVVVTGAGGQVGTRVVRLLRGLSVPIEVFPVDSRALDVTARDQVHALVAALRPDWIVNCAAYTAVDRAESEPERAYAANAMAVRWLVEAAEGAGTRVCHFSSDYVFDGTLGRAYREWDQTNPLGVYGASKLAGEMELRNGIDLCLRSAWVMSASSGNTAATIGRLALAGREMRFVDDQFGSPTSADDLAAAAIRLLLSSYSGRFHVVNAGAASWFQVARHLASCVGADPGLVQPAATAEMRELYRAPRPVYSVLDATAISAGGVMPMRDWHDALAAVAAEALGAKAWE